MVPHPSSMIYEKVVIFDSTLSSQKVVPHPSSSYKAESAYICKPNLCLEGLVFHFKCFAAMWTIKFFVNRITQIRKVNL